eukprot:3420413-Rhodomonas_salina.1
MRSSIQYKIAAVPRRVDENRAVSHRREKLRADQRCKQSQRHVISCHRALSLRSRGHAIT